jgi:hypothetical protein
LTREVGIRDTEIAALRRESEIKDQRVITFGQDAAEKGVELEKLRAQLEEPAAETESTREINEPSKKEEESLRVAPAAACDGSDPEVINLKTLLAEKNAELESLRQLLDEQIAAQLKRASLTKNLQKSLAEKDEAYGRLDKENRRLVVLNEEKTIDHAFWIRIMGDKDVHIRNLDATITNLRNELAAQAAATAKPPSVSVEVIPQEMPGDLMDIELLRTQEEANQPLAWHARLRRWMLRLVGRWLARSVVSAAPTHVRRENRVRDESESLIDTR